ncbi:MAG: hypothetical protein ACYSYV_12795 [Planctomycetota bacterium]
MQVTDDHFEQAAHLPDATDEATQNATQQMSAQSCMTSHPVCESAKFDIKRDPARHCESLMGDAGFEPATG